MSDFVLDLSSLPKKKSEVAVNTSFVDNSKPFKAISGLGLLIHWSNWTKVIWKLAKGEIECVFWNKTKTIGISFTKKGSFMAIDVVTPTKSPIESSQYIKSSEWYSKQQKEKVATMEHMKVSETLEDNQDEDETY